MTTFTISCGDRDLVLGDKTRIMGILNVTPDSFSDGGAFLGHGDALRHAKEMVAAGADIIDIGGESSRPFADPVSEAEEIRRVVPVVEALAGKIPVPISVDTVKAAVAEAALSAGAAIINDISALTADPRMAPVAAEKDAPVILMHMRGTPETMQLDTTYEDLTGDIARYLAGVAERAVAGGIRRSQIILDPGIGFGKTVRHNFAILKHLEVFTALGMPVMIGSSRKSFIGKTLAGETGAAADRAAIETGTQATVAAAILNGAHIVRVHDVVQTAATVRIIDALRAA